MKKQTGGVSENRLKWKIAPADFPHRPVHYFPELARVAGGVASGVLLSYFVGLPSLWSDSEGWHEITQREIMEHTFLSRSEQETARRNLKARGILQERRKGVPAKMFYRLNAEMLEFSQSFARGSGVA